MSAKSGWCIDGLHEQPGRRRLCRYTACGCTCHGAPTTTPASPSDPTPDLLELIP